MGRTNSLSISASLLQIEVTDSFCIIAACRPPRSTKYQLMLLKFVIVWDSYLRIAVLKTIL